MITAKIQNIIFSARIYLLIIACAGFHTMVILSAINYFIDMNYMIARLVGIICFFGLSAYFLIAFSKKLREASQGKLEQ
jgi:hypothetical protein